MYLLCELCDLCVTLFSSVSVSFLFFLNIYTNRLTAHILYPNYLYLEICYVVFFDSTKLDYDPFVVIVSSICTENSNSRLIWTKTVFDITFLFFWVVSVFCLLYLLCFAFVLEHIIQLNRPIDRDIGGVFLSK